MLIITADDLGLNHQVNLAIIRAFERGFCSDGSIMPNMPGFEEACELVRRHGLADHVGLHLVLTEGTPVTEPIKDCPRFCGRNGCFRLSRKQRIVRLSPAERNAVAIEIDGQIARCRKRGITVAHLDSHSHAHEEWGIVPLVIEAARKTDIPRIRLCRTPRWGTSPVKWLYRHLVNRRIRAAGRAGTEHFGSPDDCIRFYRGHGTSKGTDIRWEIMVHPVFDGAGRLFDGWLHRPLEELIETLRQCRARVPVMNTKLPRAMTSQAKATDRLMAPSSQKVF